MCVSTLRQQEETKVIEERRDTIADSCILFYSCRNHDAVLLFGTPALWSRSAAREVEIWKINTTNADNKMFFCNV